MVKIESEITKLVTTPNAPESICSTAIDSWNTVFKPAELLEVLQEYVIASTDENLDEIERKKVFDEVFKIVKNTRKAAQYLRTCYILLDKEHDSPKELSTLYWQLGQLKDSLYMPEVSQITTQSLVLLLSSPLSQLESLSIELDTPEGILTATQQPLATIRALVDADSLSAKNFHTMRKKLRLFANIYTLAQQTSSEEVVRQLRQELVSINDELGTINDEMVQASIDGGTPYEDNTVRVSKELKERITSLLDASPANHVVQ